MTGHRNLVLSSLYTLLFGLILGCATTGSSSKTSPPNFAGDAAQTTDDGTEFQSSDHAENSSGFAQPPADSTGFAPESERSAQRSTPPATKYQELAPAAAAPAMDSMPARSRTQSATGRESASSSAGATRDLARPAPLRKSVERPGLATLWGETRESRVTTTSFARNSDQPSFLYRIQYDDEAGIRSRTGLDPFSFGSNHMQSQHLLTVEIVDGSGNPLPGVMQGSRPLVVGHHGDRYGIRVTNHSTERFEVVATVDGLDVLDGRPGSYAKRGYLVDANSSLEIEGFRRSTSEVAAFRFGSVKDSYAARTSGDRNVGVIGVAVFREYQRVYPDRFEENHRRDIADPFPRYATPPPAPVPIIRD